MTEMTIEQAAADARQDLRTHGQVMPAQERREEARLMYRESVEAEMPVSAEALGRAFGRSTRWGRDRIAEVRAQDIRQPTESGGMPQPTPASDHTDHGSAPAAGRHASDLDGMPLAESRMQPDAGMPPVGDRKATAATAGMPRLRRRTGEAMSGRQRFVATVLGVLAGVVAGVGTLAVAAAGFTLSFDAIRSVGEAAYIQPRLAWMLPVCVDGAMSVATVCAVVLRRMGRRPVYPWLVVLAGAGISIAANALHAYQQGGAVPLPPQWAMTVSAVPPLLLAMSVHLLVILAVALREIGRP